jgi:hypothetical protein
LELVNYCQKRTNVNQMERFLRNGSWEIIPGILTMMLMFYLLILAKDYENWDRNIYKIFVYLLILKLSG